jgi:hypothetical protein
MRRWFGSNRNAACHNDQECGGHAAHARGTSASSSLRMRRAWNNFLVWRSTTSSVPLVSKHPRYGRSLLRQSRPISPEPAQKKLRLRPTDAPACHRTKTSCRSSAPGALQSRFHQVTVSWTRIARLTDMDTDTSLFSSGFFFVRLRPSVSRRRPKSVSQA